MGHGSTPSDPWPIDPFPALIHLPMHAIQQACSCHLVPHKHDAGRQMLRTCSDSVVLGIHQTNHGRNYVKQTTSAIDCTSTCHVYHKTLSDLKPTAAQPCTRQVWPMALASCEYAGWQRRSTMSYNSRNDCLEDTEQQSCNWLEVARTSHRRTRLSTVGDGAFPLAVAHVWNSLYGSTSYPRSHCQSSAAALKRYLFRRCFPWLC